MCDPKALHSGLSPDVARSIAGALEAEGRRKMQGAGFAVPPFDMCSGQVRRDSCPLCGTNQAHIRIQTSVCDGDLLVRGSARNAI
jgi:hypothetical protein